MNKIEVANNLIDFIYDSPTPFHVINNVKKILGENGFVELKEEESWNLKKGNKYYVCKNNSAIIALKVGEDDIEKGGFRIIGAHTDSPTFKIKPKPEIFSDGGYIKLNTEVYGGPILNTWLDRPLSIAGRVMVRGENPFNPLTKLLNIKKPILIIPNLAIHMNRNVNKGIELNPQKNTLPIISLIKDKLEKEDYILNLISKELNVDKSDILDFEIYLYEFEKGCIIGADDEFISSSRLDDLSMVQAGIKAITTASDSHNTNVLVCFDNEEVGSCTKQGADSNMLKNVLERVCISLNKDREEFFRALSKSFIISCDSAHAIHPNSPEKCDLTNKPSINKGPAIKLSASQSYTTDAYSASVYKEICKRANIPVQSFVNRSDERGGSTIGPISSTHLDIPSVDIGTPLLAMHSIRELAGVDDQLYTIKSFIEFYNL